MRVLYFTIVFFLLLSSCKEDRSIQFSQLEKDRTGISFRNILEETEEFNVLNYTYFYNGGGVAIGDINNDGLSDILFTGNMVKNRLYLNKGDFRFEDITAKSGVSDKQGWCTGASMVDINTDGLLDIYICRSADGLPEKRKNLLFINNGDLSFTEKAAEYGLDDSGYSTQASFFDYDRDGDLDCFVINHSLQQFTTGALENAALRNKSNPDFSSKLYQNNNGRFTDVSAAANIQSNVFSFGLGIAISDFNNDLWPDIYLSNDFNEHDYYFLNNANGYFTESVSRYFDYVSLYSMGSDAADFNNDGLTDIVTLDMLPEDNFTQKMHSGAENFEKFQYLFEKGFYYQYSRNMLQKNNGDGSFSEVGQLAGISNTDWSWAPLFADFDNDGFKDLFVSNGYVKDYTDMDFIQYTMNKAVMAKQSNQKVAVQEVLRNMPDNKISNYAFHNNGNGTFTNQASAWGLSRATVSAGAAYGDLDNDGDLDLVVNNSNEEASIFRNNNETSQKNAYLRVQLKGPSGNRQGVGSKIKIYCGGEQYFQEQYPVRGFQSSVDPTLVFGLGNHQRIDSVVIYWPNGEVQRPTSVAVNSTLTVAYSPAGNALPAHAEAPALVTDTLAVARHIENTFNDYSVQRLLPSYYSRLGPCLAVADVNKDGMDDFYLGGAAQQAGQLFMQDASGAFKSSPGGAFKQDAASEDVAAVFADFNRDGSPDLYVASGGYEFRANDVALQDRIYLNDGRGNFMRDEGALPSMLTSTGSVSTVDFDGDGDLDVFAGGRIVPGNYPVAPRSYLLQNDGKGKFTDITDLAAPGLAKVGMVTGSAWMDLNADQSPELVLVGEWMPVMVFDNKKGVLQNASSKYITHDSFGWWNLIQPADLDGDGDLDLVLGNQGRNTQFQASPAEPVTITYKDFDGNGTIDPLLSYYIHGVSYPAVSRDDLADQVPIIKKKYLSYKDYASATSNTLFSPELIKDAITLKATAMETVLLENHGAAGFRPLSLPLEAQYGPVYAAAVMDLNADKKPDILLAGGNSFARIRFGKYSASHGVALVNKGENKFEFLPQQFSGLDFRKDVRNMQSIRVDKKPGMLVAVNDGPVLYVYPKK
ncbi:VCBS repeat-containing protein [Flavihumibacter sp. RY-1]|uniref:VCBS repeat-containing protein n=1 Tax=Flavihumibacter fluminis TaxID=2909236 RepID=A0ABS9BJ33_9BACT|nr:VCBS repeat-containing protein [Flavihumibacter fluminis]MCF1715636.1 VCBS repeat-containing protein [Flavihumibacter fluminis]